MRANASEVRSFGAASRRSVLCCAAALVACSESPQEEEPPSADRTFGVVEGFYGTPYEPSARVEMLRFLGEIGFDTYVYAPKSDALHRSKWRDPYAADAMAHFAELATVGRDAGVRFVFAISPGLDFDPDGGDQTTLEDKLASFVAIGVRDFCVFFDDILATSRGVDPNVQVELVKSTRARLADLADGTTLCFISNHYIGTAAEIETDTTPFAALFPRGSSEYYAAYRALPKDVPILWTGRRVFSNEITLGQATDFAKLANRDVIVWDNYPVNDTVLSRELYLGPYVGREPGIEKVLRGVWLNPMTLPEASKIALFTASRRFELAGGYDAARAHRDALERLAPGAADEVTTLAEHFAGHPMIGPEAESAELAGLVDAFFADSAREGDLRALLGSYAMLRASLASRLTNARLLGELAAPTDKLGLLSEAALVALDLLAKKRNGETVDPSGLDTAIAAADANPWLVGANTTVPSTLAESLSERTPADVNVFGRFFERARAELAK